MYVFDASTEYNLGKVPQNIYWWVMTAAQELVDEELTYVATARLPTSTP